jgi:hypothetical protein
LQVGASFSDSDYQLFYGCYRHLAARQDVELRRNCAANFPMVRVRDFKALDLILSSDGGEFCRCGGAAHQLCR